MTIAEIESTPELLVAQELEEAARFLDVEPWIVQRLHQPEREVHLNLQIKGDDGRPLMLKAVRVQHSSVRGPSMGPIIFSKTMSVADVRALAMRLTWRWALWEMPFGGAAGMVSADVNDLSESELKSVVAAYVQALRGTIGYDADVLTPSETLPSQVMAWALAAMGTHRGAMASVTGKPSALQGIGRHEIAGKFVRDLIRTALRDQGEDLIGKKVVVVGFDAQAQAVAAELQMAGANVIAVADSSGAVLRHAGLNVEMLRNHVAKEGVVFGFNEGDSVTFDAMVKDACDVLILADGEELVLRPNTRWVVEERGIMSTENAGHAAVIPHVLAGFGTGFADFLEWRKSACGTLTDLDTVREMRAHVRHTWKEVNTYARAQQMSWKDAAVIIGMGRVANAMRSL
ncbi:MAG TPA: Glu/Leu/Phe/Val dehydrogenase dimerization domain-containing protein [Terriglobales bacterium]|nr:Glu/Leu/Phe/Val dehydrogenase dimerization domain-containing protein [Terriglobales bacterium]